MAHGEHIICWNGASNSGNAYYYDPDYAFKPSDLGRPLVITNGGYAETITQVVANYDMTAQGQGVHNVVILSDAHAYPGADFGAWVFTDGLGWGDTAPPVTASLDTILHIGDSITAALGVTDREREAYAATGRTVTEINRGISGTNTNDWLPGGANLAPALAAGTAAGAGTLELMLGTNDAREAVSAGTYLANMQAIISAALAPGTGIQLVKVFEIPFVVPDAYNGLWPHDNEPLITAYNASHLQLTGVTLAGQGAYQFFKTYPELLGDGVHPNTEGAVQLGRIWAGIAPDYLPPVPPATPTSFIAGAPKITLSWGSVDGATGYRLYRDDDTTPVYDGIALAYPEAVSSETHLYTVSSYNANGESPKSAAVSAGIIDTVIPIGALTTALSRISDTEIQVAWGAVPGAISYKILRSADGIYYTVVGTAPGSPTTGTRTYPDTGTTLTQKYYYHVVPVYPV